MTRKRKAARAEKGSGRRKAGAGRAADRPARGTAKPPGPLTVGATLREVRRLFAQIAGPASMAVVLVEVPLVILVLAGDPTGGVVPMIYGLVALIGVAAAIHLALQHYESDDPLRLGPAFKVAFLSFIGLVAAGIFSGLMVLAFGLLLIVPGIIRLLGYSLIAPLIVSGESYGIDALGESLRRMKGYRLTAFWSYLVVWIPAVLWQGLYAAVFGMERAFGNTAEELPLMERVIEALFVGLYPVLELPVTLLAVVLFWEIKRRR